MDANTINSIAQAIVAKRVDSAVENRVNARGGTAKDKAAVKRRIAELLG